MKTELITQEAAKCGIEETEAKELTKGLPQIVAERDIFEKQYDDIIKLPIENKSTWELAKALRLRIVKNRTQGINKWHKTAKDYFKKGADFVDAIKRKEVQVNERMEENLAQIEKYEQLIEQKRIDDLQAVRVELIRPYIEDAEKMQLGTMADDVWEAFYFMKKTKFEEAIEAEQLAADQFKAKEKEIALHEERKAEILKYWQFVTHEESKLNLAKMPNFEAFVSELQFRETEYKAEQAEIKAENERLQEEAKEREKKALEAKEENDRLNKAGKARQEMFFEIGVNLDFESCKNMAEETWSELYEEKNKAYQYEQNRLSLEKMKAEADRKAQAKIIADQKKALQEKEQVEKEAEAARQDDLNKNDEAKITDLVNDLRALKTKYTFKSEKNQKRYAQVSGLIEKIATYILK